MKKVFIIACFFYCFFSSNAATYFVAFTGTPTGNATSWATASSDLQWVINTKATFGDQIFVQMGPYYAPVGLGFQMKEGVKIYGGFRGNETALNQRDWANNITKLIALNGRVITNDNNGLSNEALLDGFSIENGSLNGSGGGMYNSKVSPSVFNCTFRNNRSAGSLGGGAVFINEGSPVFFNCSFSTNSTSANGASGGAVLCQGNGSFYFEECTFDNNTVESGGIGGAISISSGGSLNNASIVGCSFFTNKARSGAAIVNASHLRIFRSYFNANVAAKGSNAIIDNFGNIQINSSVFTHNKTPKSTEGDMYAGALLIGYLASVSKINGCTFWNNDQFVTKIFNTGSGLPVFPWLTEAFPPELAAKIYISNSVANSKLHLFTATVPYFNAIYAANSLFTGALPFNNCIDVVPRFVDADHPLGPDGIIGTADDGLRLQQNSPAVNRGSLSAINSSEPWDYIDFMGNLRIEGPYMDMGAYESPYTTTAALPATFGTISATRSGNSLNVNWQTLSEKNVKHYEVQVSANGEQFATVKTVNTKAENGSSDQILDYSTTITINELAAYMGFPVMALLLMLALLPAYVKQKKLAMLAVSLAVILTACSKQNSDVDTEKNTTLYLRLAQTDIDGTVNYSKTIKVVPQ